MSDELGHGPSSPTKDDSELHHLRREVAKLRHRLACTVKECQKLDMELQLQSAAAVKAKWYFDEEITRLEKKFESCLSTVQAQQATLEADLSTFCNKQFEVENSMSDQFRDLEYRKRDI